MADSLTLLQLRTRTRERADQENSTRVTDSELNGYIDYSYKEFYDLLVQAVEDYNLTTFSFSITSGNTQAVPTDFFKMRGLDDVSDSTRPRTVKKYNWNERNEWAYGQAAYLEERFSDVAYRLIGSNITIMPPERAVKPYKLYYVPIPATLSADGDVATGINGWLEYVILDAAIKCKYKDEEDAKPLLAAKRDIFLRIEALKSSRDQGTPEKISRIRTRRKRMWYGESEEYLP